MSEFDKKTTPAATVGGTAAPSGSAAASVSAASGLHRRTVKCILTFQN